MYGGMEVLLERFCGCGLTDAKRRAWPYTNFFSSLAVESKKEAENKYPIQQKGQKKKERAKELNNNCGFDEFFILDRYYTIVRISWCRVEHSN